MAPTVLGSNHGDERCLLVFLIILQAASTPIAECGKRCRWEYALQREYRSTIKDLVVLSTYLRTFFVGRALETLKITLLLAYLGGFDLVLRIALRPPSLSRIFSNTDRGRLELAESVD